MHFGCGTRTLILHFAPPYNVIINLADKQTHDTGKISILKSLTYFDHLT